MDRRAANPGHLRLADPAIHRDLPGGGRCQHADGTDPGARILVLLRQRPARHLGRSLAAVPRQQRADRPRIRGRCSRSARFPAIVQGPCERRRTAPGRPCGQRRSGTARRFHTVRSPVRVVRDGDHRRTCPAVDTQSGTARGVGLGARPGVEHRVGTSTGAGSFGCALGSARADRCRCARRGPVLPLVHRRRTDAVTAARRTAPGTPDRAGRLARCTPQRWTRLRAAGGRLRVVPVGRNRRPAPSRADRSPVPGSRTGSPGWCSDGRPAQRLRTTAARRMVRTRDARADRAPIRRCHRGDAQRSRTRAVPDHPARPALDRRDVGTGRAGPRRAPGGRHAPHPGARRTHTRASRCRRGVPGGCRVRPRSVTCRDVGVGSGTDHPRGQRRRGRRPRRSRAARSRSPAAVRRDARRPGSRRGARPRHARNRPVVGVHRHQPPAGPPLVDGVVEPRRARGGRFAATRRRPRRQPARAVRSRRRATHACAARGRLRRHPRQLLRQSNRLHPRRRPVVRHRRRPVDRMARRRVRTHRRARVGGRPHRSGVGADGDDPATDHRGDRSIHHRDPHHARRLGVVRCNARRAVTSRPGPADRTSRSTVRDAAHRGARGQRRRAQHLRRPAGRRTSQRS